MDLLKKFGDLKDKAGKSYTLTSWRMGTKGHVILKLKGLETPEDAKLLRGLCLYGPRDVLPALTPDQFYHQDLLGMEVHLQDGQVLKVSGVYNFGAGDVLELEGQAPFEGSFMIPFRKETVLEVDMQTRTLKIDEAFLISDKGKD